MTTEERQQQGAADAGRLNQCMATAAWKRVFACIMGNNAQQLEQVLREIAATEDYFSVATGVSLWKNGCGESLVYIAAKKNQSELLRVMLSHLGEQEKHVLLSQFRERERGMLPLHVASEMGHLECAQEIVEHIRNMDNQIDSYGLTPLHRAARNGHSAVCSTILSSGGNMFRVDNVGFSAWHRACFNGQTQVCSTFIQFAQKNGLKNQLVRNDKVRLLGRSSLHLIAANVTQGSAVELVALLIQEKIVCVNTTSSEGRTPLHEAAIHCNVPVTRALLRFGGDPNTKDAQGKTPLHLAVENYHVAICEEILKHNLVDFYVVDSDGCTARDIALESGKFEILCLFDGALEQRQDEANVTVNSQCSGTLKRHPRGLSEIFPTSSVSLCDHEDTFVEDNDDTADE
eukprot:CAMPEP_0203763122 /NCGR_PEP_ID=MMETSP0098-20131031/15796_1 /ASSEMBLY_ACC=CAM_ASM_000208 /TAXON_ID=96639 /ORGANISM=" , Strain NY0313808BC1" /LENGTH=401 /DNA_ID=CAMNT_0050657729 /DNA_START=555 /DNA_END=1760 /DNA_ORIENTATION=-